MPKSLSELTREEYKPNNLAIASANGGDSDPPLSISIEAFGPEYVVSPQQIYVQSRVTSNFSALATLVDVWNKFPTRTVTISRLQGETVVSSLDYVVTQLTPKSGELMLPELDISAISGTPLAGTTLKVELDGILSDEWQGGLVTYKHRFVGDLPA